MVYSAPTPEPSPGLHPLLSLGTRPQEVRPGPPAMALRRGWLSGSWVNICQLTKGLTV